MDLGDFIQAAAKEKAAKTAATPGRRALREIEESVHASNPFAGPKTPPVEEKPIEEPTVREIIERVEPPQAPSAIVTVTQITL